MFLSLTNAQIIVASLKLYTKYTEIWHHPYYKYDIQYSLWIYTMQSELTQEQQIKTKL